MTFRLGFCDTGHPSKIGLLYGYIYDSSCGHVLLFTLPIFHRDDLDFPDHNSKYTVRHG